MRANPRNVLLLALLVCASWVVMLNTWRETPVFRTEVETLKSHLRQRESELEAVLADAKKSKLTEAVREPVASIQADEQANSPATTELHLSASHAQENFNATKFYHDVTDQSDSLVRELMLRRNTRYWLESKPDWPTDAIPPTDRFVTFSPWKGGFNNIRMSLEIAAAFAIATNRTLVIPPAQSMYLRGKSSLTSYFDLEDMRRGLSVVTYDEFFELTDFGQYQKEKPSGSNPHSTLERYFKGLQSMPGVYHMQSHWRSEKVISDQVVYCFPNCPSSDSTSKQDKIEYSWFTNFKHHRTGYDGDNQELNDARIVHFKENLLGHFYTFLYFRDPQEGRRIKRIIRDHVHFREEIIEYAERIITKLRDFKYSCIHVRRNDFQFGEAFTSAEDIVKNTKGLFPENEIIYVATDELSDNNAKRHSWSKPDAMVKHTTHTWFNPFREHWGGDKVWFMSDFYNELLQDVPSIYLGCIDTLICSRARRFVGTRKSTFSGYINRLRGYMHDVGQKFIFEAQSTFPEDYQKFLGGPDWYRIKPGYGGGHPYWGLEYKDVWEGVYDPFA
mmetsp:Transcript_4018/g.7053  ORF Transcript_4018/g.7053 Transcript_4018/m.7053 type:complete len:559 (+) Transcript_4018:131-1807(+)